MASLTLITISFLNVLAIFTQTCKCEYSLPPAHLYTEARFPKNPGHGSVVYIPAHIGNLPLQDHGQTYHAHLDVGSRQFHQSSVASNFHAGTSGGHDQHLSGASHHDHGSASVYQQSNHHSSEQKHSIHHHGSGVSHQVFKQEHQQGQHVDLSSQVHDHDHYQYDKSDELHHKKDENVHYQFEYLVNDHKTGDVKRHREDRKGDVVNGEYSLLEEDGNVRTVKYYADWKSGFHAQVHNTKPKSVG
ncbi:histidine-rich glycoprotein-like isoform X2 [Zophobas morio]|uniref:histidine-rich glycoprotein-like isoform X2 n=1 Tax=Zophobas morio TaxID=2755281 RepID=UPI003083A159